MNEVASAYAFRAVRPDGGVEAGAVVAVSREAAVALVASRGVYPIEVSRRSRASLALARATPDDLALGLRALATLLRAGLPTSRALLVLEGLVPACWTAALPAVRDRIEQGEPLAAALRTSTLPLPPHVLGIIESGEAGTGMAAAVESAAQLLEARAAMNAALWNALSYPILLAATGTAAIALLVGVVLPRFAELMLDTAGSLPAATRLLLGLAGATEAAAIPGLFVVASAVVGWRVWTARPNGRRRWHALLLRAPVLGSVRRSAATAHACSTLAALLSAGVPLSSAIPLAARSAGDAAAEAALLAARARIVTGESFSSALHAERAVSLTAIRFVRIGEEAGGLGSMLEHAARIESAAAIERLKRLIRLVEPSLILVFGGIVMAVAAALLQAIYGLRPSF